ncbi:beta-galactosidase [Microbacterium sp. KUDC0406]|uniref:beta-galactosidase n=1 Tax=Microbacterium sp. KUDC0406 TaxID=2909588 RepID=UPI001F3ACA56|nr:beta-galactosidase [Microbacterium sp. KUDC0406]UJP09622.1 beta-galactosidase [Microbacterium sp. KUDC0406]
MRREKQGWLRHVGRTALVGSVAMAMIGGAVTLTASAAPAAVAASKAAIVSFPGNDGAPHRVTWDSHSFKVDGERLNIWSGEFHYWRLPAPEQWRDLMQKLKSAGFNAVSLYFFWGLHQSERGGDFDFTGIRDVDRLLTMAEEEGLYVIARPGPYINAEISMGGLPAYMTNVDAPLRGSEDPQVLADSKAWLSAVNRIIGKHQVTDGGGSVLMYQVENELLDDSPQRKQFLTDLTASVKVDGITVPVFHNDWGMGGRFRDVDTYGLDFYAYDNYPLGFNCGAQRNRIGESETAFRAIAPDTPQFITESQGGAFTPWGAAFDTEQCYSYTDEGFTRQWGARNVGNGVTAYNSYMAFGGTNWGWTGSPSSGFTSYDYGAALNEDRTITPKFAAQKEVGAYLQAVPDLASMRPLAAPSATVESGSAVQAYQRIATDQDAASATDDGSTRFLGFRLADSNDTTTTRFTFPLILGAAGDDSGSGVVSTDDRDAGIAYTGSWKQVADGGAHDGTLTTSTAAGAKASFTFSGTSVQLVTSTGTDHGTARVTIDGVDKGTFSSHVDTDQNKPVQQVSFEATDLAPGVHTIVVENLGTPIDGGTGTVVAIDAFQVPDDSKVQWNDDVDDLVFTGSWEHATGKNWTSGDIGGDETFSSKAGDAYEFTFTGAGFELIGPHSENHGPADVYIDGEKAGRTSEQVTSSAQPQKVLFSQRDLAYGEHTVKVVVTGERFEGSSGSFHSLDAVNIYRDADSGSVIPDGRIGWERVPQKAGTSLTLHGRDALMLTADTRIGDHALYYTTSQLFGAPLQRRGGVVQYAIGYAGDDGETVLHYDSEPKVTLPPGVERTWNAERGELRLNYVHGAPADIVVDDGEQPLTLRIMDREHAADVWFIDGGSKGTVVVEGAYLPRDVRFHGAVATLTGSMAESGSLRIDVPDGIKQVRWNSTKAKASHGIATLRAPGPKAVTVPKLTWVTASDDAEAEPRFDDSRWTVADDTAGTRWQGPGANQKVVLDSNHYGFYEGSVWYRAHYTAAQDGGTLRLQGNGGSGQPGHGKAPAFMQVWVNGVYAGSPRAAGGWQDVAVPDGAVKAGDDVVVSVLVNNLGQNLDWSDDGLSRQNRGLYDAVLTDGGSGVTWRIEGATAADADPVRTIYNNGGLSGERKGWHLPNFNDRKWKRASSLVADGPGVDWYRSSFRLNVPRGQDTAFRLTVNSPKFDVGRTDGSQATIFVNGWNTGVYIGDIGPQKQFTIPSAFLNMRGKNEISIAVAAKAAGMGPESVTLEAVHSTTGGLGG